MPRRLTLRKWVWRSTSSDLSQGGRAQTSQFTNNLVLIGRGLQSCTLGKISDACRSRLCLITRALILLPWINSSVHAGIVFFSTFASRNNIYGAISEISLSKSTNITRNALKQYFSFTRGYSWKAKQSVIATVNYVWPKRELQRMAFFPRSLKTLLAEVPV